MPRVNKCRLQLSGMKLKNFRRRHRMKQADLAKVLGVTKGMISFYETGRCGFTWETINRVAKKLGLPVSDITEERVEWREF